MDQRNSNGQVVSRLNYCNNPTPPSINTGLGDASAYLPTQTDVNNYCAGGVCIEYCNPFNVSREPLRERMLGAFAPCRQSTGEAGGERWRLCGSTRTSPHPWSPPLERAAAMLARGVGTRMHCDARMIYSVADHACRAAEFDARPPVSRPVGGQRARLALHDAARPPRDQVGVRRTRRWRPSCPTTSGTA